MKKGGDGEASRCSSKHAVCIVNQEEEKKEEEKQVDVNLGNGNEQRRDGSIGLVAVSCDPR